MGDKAKELCRLLVVQAAEKMDEGGLEVARAQVSMVKIIAPKMCQDVADRAMQIFGGHEVCRISDGPGEVHMSQLVNMTIWELKP